MRLPKQLPAFLILCLSVFHASHADSLLPKPIFNSSDGNVSVQIEVILPESYDSTVERAYPVLYLLDGYWNKEPVGIMYNHLRFDNMIPEIIVISIGYPDSITDYETQRIWDLTPTYDSGFEAGGNATALLEVLTKQITPFISENYRIDDTRTILSGHSLAGLFTLFVMYQESGSFTHYAAISPSALWADESLSKLDQDFAQHSSKLNTNLYITYGTDEYAPYVRSLENYTQTLRSRNYEELNLSLATVEGFRHVGMKSEGYLRAIVWSLDDLRPGGPSEFEKKNLKALERKKDGQTR